MKQHIKVLSLILFFLICFIPQFLAYLNGQNDPHSYSWIAPAQVTLNEHRVLIHPYSSGAEGHTLQNHTNTISERSAMTTILAILSLITGQPLTAVQFFPIGGIILPLVSFALSKYILRSSWYAAAFTFFISYEPIIIDATYNVSEHTWGFILFFIFMLLFLKSVQELSFRTIGIILSLFVFMTTFLSYYSTEVYEIVFALSMSLLIGIALKLGWLKKADASGGTLFKLAFVFLIIFVTYDSLFYSYIARIANNVTDVGSFFSGYLDHLVIVLTGAAERELTGFNPYYPPGQSLSTAIGFSIIAYLIILVVAGFAETIIRKLRQLRFMYIITIQLLFSLSILAVVAVSIVIYILIGNINFLLIIILFPLISLYLIQQFKVASVVKYGLVGIMLVLALLHLGAGWYYELYPNRAQMYMRIGSASDYIVSTIAKESKVLTDIEIGGKLLIDATAAKKDFAIGQYYYESQTVNNIVPLYSEKGVDLKAVLTQFNFKYLIISEDNITSGIHTGWRSYPPLGDNIKNINSFNFLNLVYNDGYIYTYQYHE